MNGQMMNYKRYNQYIKTMPSPIMPSDLPKRKINLSAIAKYAKDNNICIASLSDTEKEHHQTYSRKFFSASYTSAPTTWYNSSCIFSSKYFFSQMFLFHFFCG